MHSAAQSSPPLLPAVPSLPRSPAGGPAACGRADRTAPCGFSPAWGGEPGQRLWGSTGRPGDIPWHLLWTRPGTPDSSGVRRGLLSRDTRLAGQAALVTPRGGEGGWGAETWGEGGWARGGARRGIGRAGERVAAGDLRRVFSSAGITLHRPKDLEGVPRDSCRGGPWAAPLGAVRREPMLPRLRCGPLAKPRHGSVPGRPEEFAGSAEDRPWSLVLTPRGTVAPEGSAGLAAVPGRGLWRSATGQAAASQDHLGRDAEEEVVIPSTHLQQQGRLGQHGLLQLA